MTRRTTQRTSSSTSGKRILDQRSLGGVIALVAVGLVAWWLSRADRAATPTATAPAPAAPPAHAAPPAPVARAPGPSQPDDTSGTIDGRVLDAVTREGVAGAELSFLGTGHAISVRTSSDGTFELAPTVTGAVALTAITAAGYFPYAPQLGDPGLRVTLAHGRPVQGVTLLLQPAVDHSGVVVDAHGAPVAEARVRVIGGRASDALEGPATAWHTGRDGRFAFQAPDDAVLEASRGSARGCGRIDPGPLGRNILVIRLGEAPARDATITGRVRDPSGAPIADAVVRAAPSIRVAGVATVFATTAADGSFTLTGADHGAYDVSAEVDDRIPARRDNVLGGSRNVELTIDAGLPLSGHVVESIGGAPIAAFTLTVQRRAGLARPTVLSRALIDPAGEFTVHVPRGDYDLIATATGFARSAPVAAAAGSRDARIVVGHGATVRGQVVAAADHGPIGDAEIARDVTLGTNSALPGEPTATSRPDGSFELTGLAAGPLTLQVRTRGYYTKVEADLTARDGGVLGPLIIELTALPPDRPFGTELVGVGLNLLPDGDALRIVKILPGSSALDAGVDYGDRIVAVDGTPVTALGLDATLDRLRGTAGTLVTLTLRRDGRDVSIVVERRLIRS